MPIWSPSSRRCFVRSFALFLAAIPLISGAHAAIETSQPTELSRSQKLRAWIRSDLAAHQDPSFEPLLKKWSQRFGPEAIPVLSQIIRDQTQKDEERYIALMGMAKLGGKAIAPELLPFLKDPSWMIRSGTLRALAVLGHPKTASAVLPLLKDPALVVRLEAVSAVEALRPKGAKEALIAVIKDPKNTFGGKQGKWVPERAREALRKLND